MGQEIFLKIDCWLCGNPIEFPREMLSQIIECPHCQKEIWLGLPPKATLPQTVPLPIPSPPETRASPPPMIEPWKGTVYTIPCKRCGSPVQSGSLRLGTELFCGHCRNCFTLAPTIGQAEDILKKRFPNAKISFVCEADMPLYPRPPGACAFHVSEGQVTKPVWVLVNGTIRERSDFDIIMIGLKGFWMVARGLCFAAALLAVPYYLCAALSSFGDIRSALLAVLAEQFPEDPLPQIGERLASRPDRCLSVLGA